MVVRCLILFYLEHERDQPEDYPFLLELAHYEWVELALDLATDTLAFAETITEDELLRCLPVISPLAWVLQYQYPVHLIGPECIPDKAPEAPTHIIVYRDRANQVQFMEINEVTAKLLQLIQQNKVSSSKQALLTIAKELGSPDPNALVTSGLAILQSLQKADIIIGIRSTHKESCS